MTYKVIDLFAGAGGMTLGFVDPKLGGGFQSVWANDNNKDAVATYNLNFGKHAVCGDIEKLVKEAHIPQADVVIGGPPCQGFSLLNKNRDGDSRRALWQPFIDVVQRSNASIFIIENVSGLLTSPEYLEGIKPTAEALGFIVIAKILNAADYGAPQTRKRTVIIGYKAGKTHARFPTQTHAQKTEGTLKPWITVREVIGDLPEPVGTEPRHEERDTLRLHFGRSPTEMSLKRYKAVPVGGNRFDLHKNAPEITPACWVRKTTGGTDLFGRLWWDRPSVTIRTEFFKPEKGRYLHPDQHRPITHREAARLMGFPDTFVFQGSKTEIARQIGNAVPPKLAAAIAKVVREYLDLSQTTADNDENILQAA